MNKIAPQKSSRDVQHVKFGEHLIFDAYGCNPDKLDSKEFCLNLLEKICEIANMKKLHAPFIIKADGNETLGGKDPGGYSGFLMIQESHISIHTFVRRKFVTLDVYSCKEFETEELINFLKNEFEAEDIDVLKMERGLKYPAENLF